MTDKAKEYAEQIMTRLKPAAFHGRDVLIMDPEDAKTLVSIAYRAGYQAGLVEAHRKEWVQEQPTHFERGFNDPR